VKQITATLLFIFALFQFLYDAIPAENYRRTVRGIWLGQPATAQNVVPATAGYNFATVSSPRRILRRVTVQHQAATGVTAVVGLLADSAWEAGQWVNATTTYTADTTDAQSATTNDFPLETTTVNDGFIIGADVPFGVVSVDVTTAGSGTSTTHTLEYWNGAWTGILAVGTLIDVPRTATSEWATGEKVFMFTPPTDWVVGGSGTGVNAARYNIRVRRTNATQATAALARRIYVGTMLTAIGALAANTELTRDYGAAGLFIPGYVVGISAVFVTAEEGNTIELVAE